MCVVAFVRRAGVAQLAERQPSKLNVAGSTPVSRSKPRLLSVRRDLTGVMLRLRSTLVGSGGAR